MSNFFQLPTIFKTRAQKETFAFRAVIVLAILVSIASTLYCYYTGLVYSYGDGLSRLMIARRVVDGIHSGMAQLGAVWPPIPQIFMVPLIWNDFLYRTTFAGDLVSMVFYVIGVVFIYKLIFSVTKDITAGLIGALVFSNPNILYLQATPMSESAFLALVIMSIYFMMRWVQSVDKMQYLILASIALALSTLSRFESYLLYFIEVGIIIYTSIRYRFKYFQIESYLVLFSVVALFGMVLWFLWNQLIFNNFLYFMTSEYGQRSQFTQYGNITNGGNIWLSFLVYGWSVVDNVGWLATILACLGLVYFLFKRESSVQKIVALSLLFPFVFYFLVLYKGNVVLLQVPQLMSGGYQNIRYGLLMLPAVAYFIGYIAQHRSMWLKLVIVLLVLVSSVITWQEGLVNIPGSGVYNPVTTREIVLGNWLRAHYNGGLLLLQNTGNERTTFAFSLAYPLKDVVYEGDQEIWTNSLRSPAFNVRWVFMNSNANGKPDKVWSALHGTSQLLNSYNIVYKYEGAEVYEKK